jgi:1-acyl-sn-glycerol-3-phosphate acyltransferase
MRNLLFKIFLYYPIRFIFETLLGWRVAGTYPVEPKFIGVFAPHTHFFDFALMWYCAVATRRFPNWAGKMELFENPILGKIYRRLGGIPVDRDNPMTALKQMIRSVKQMDRLALLINPEGTRQYSDHWKQGFYFVANKTNTPLILIALDYGKKHVAFSEPFYTSGDIEKDMEIIRAFYADVRGKIPERVAPIRFLTN